MITKLLLQNWLYTPDEHRHRKMRDHIVPQQMIKRFADEEGWLYELYKPKLAIATKRKRPKGILFRDDRWYQDEVSSFDDSLLKRIEQTFARYYPRFADEPWTGECRDGHAGAALVSWIAALSVRTSLLLAASRAVAAKDRTFMALAWKAAPRLTNNITRSMEYEQILDLISRPKFRWRCKLIPDEQNFVLTDNPVFITPIINGKGVIVVPLSRKRLLIGGHADAIEGWRHASIRQANGIMAAWAEKQVFAADKITLTNLIKDLRGRTWPANFRKRARRPLFGITDRIATVPSPTKPEVDRWWANHIASFGPSIVPPERRVAQ